MPSGKTHTAATLDDLLRASLGDLLKNGVRITPRRGEALDQSGMMLVLRDPRARLSRTQTRGRLFSTLGELSWYLARSDALSFIRYYIPQYAPDALEGRLPDAYGPRPFAYDGVNQVQRAIDLLRNRPDSRRAVIQLFDRSDLASNTADVPCTCTLQFLVRQEALQLVTHMRSNDAYLGLTHDVFSMTMLQELVACDLGLPLGEYIHMIGSFHLYTENVAAARAFLKEGWQSTQAPMPPMTPGSPWASVATFLETERMLREGGSPDAVVLPPDSYWSDLTQLLVVFAYVRRHESSRAREAASRLSSTVHSALVEDRVSRDMAT